MDIDSFVEKYKPIRNSNHPATSPDDYTIVFQPKGKDLQTVYDVPMSYVWAIVTHEDEYLLKHGSLVVPGKENCVGYIITQVPYEESSTDSSMLM